MKPVIQTVYGESKGNCMSACIASLLELEIDEVPCFVRDYQNKWYEAMQEWLGKKGIMLLRICLPKEYNTGEDIRFDPLPDCLCMATGQSPRGKFGHTVVGRVDKGFNFEMLHDPHPQNAGIVGMPWRLEFFVPLNPVDIKKDFKGFSNGQQ